MRLLLALFAFLMPTVHAQTVNTDWPQLQFNAQHLGRSSVQVNPNYSAKWIWLDKTHIVKNFVSTSGKSITDGFAPGFVSNVIFAGQMQPIIAAGKTYFGAVNGIFYAVNSLTGDNSWDFTTKGPILATAAYDNGVVVVPSMDGKLYGLDAATGGLKWSYQTSAGINAAPTIMAGVVYVGSRDGSFYALNVQTGNLAWSHSVGAPIMSPAAISEDGQTVLFGAENMTFYGLNTSNGSQKWSKFMVGQSFQFSWPVVVGTKVIIRTMSDIGGTEYVMDDVLTGLSANPDWLTEEKPAIANWLTQNPERKTMYVLDVNAGTEPFQVAMGTVGAGNEITPHPPVVDNLGRVLTYWRTKVSTFLATSSTAVNCFGTNFCPDLSGIDMTSGDRLKISNTNSSKLNPEIDNTFMLSVGGNQLYFDSGFRGTISINLSTGAMTRITHSLSVQDCGNFRGYPYQIIYYGNDNATYITGTCTLTSDPRPPRVYESPEGWAPVAVAAAGTTNMLYVTEPDINAVVGISGQ